jgi:hypothetical protein
MIVYQILDEERSMPMNKVMLITYYNYCLASFNSIYSAVYIVLVAETVQATACKYIVLLHHMFCCHMLAITAIVCFNGINCAFLDRNAD